MNIMHYHSECVIKKHKEITAVVYLFKGTVSRTFSAMESFSVRADANCTRVHILAVYQCCGSGAAFIWVRGSGSSGITIKLREKQS